MDVQSLIDTTGKLGPGIIALLVLFTTRRQNSWQNLANLRAAQVEDQKFRLALLDRRGVAIERVRLAVSQYWTEGAVRQDAVDAIGEALRIAELVFDEDERAGIEALLQDVWAWQSATRRLRAYSSGGRDDDHPKVQAALAEQEVAEDRLVSKSAPLILRLNEAARVRSVPPVEALPSLWRVCHRARN